MALGHSGHWHSGWQPLATGSQTRTVHGVGEPDRGREKHTMGGVERGVGGGLGTRDREAYVGAIYS
eukprot:3249058-Rhodomonas_salina.3